MNVCEERLFEKPLAVRPAENAVATYFGNNAPTWNAMYTRRDLWGDIHQQRLARFLAWVDRLNVPVETVVADIGCGAGLATLALAQRGFCVEATDVANAMIEIARQNAVAAGVQARVRANVGDIYHLGFPEAAFGLVLSIGVIPWLQSPGEAIAELARIVKPGGYLLFTADNRSRLAHLLDPATSPALGWARRGLKAILRRSNPTVSSQGSVRSYRHSLGEVDAFLNQAGLERVHSETLGFGPFTIFHRKLLPTNMEVAVNHGLQRLADMRWPLFRATGAQFLVLAKKRS